MLNYYTVVDDNGEKEFYTTVNPIVADQLMSICIADDNGDCSSQSVYEMVKALWIFKHGPLVTGSVTDKALERLAEQIDTNDFD